MVQALALILMGLTWIGAVVGGWKIASRCATHPLARVCLCALFALVIGIVGSIAIMAGCSTIEPMNMK